MKGLALYLMLPCQYSPHRAIRALANENLHAHIPTYDNAPVNYWVDGACCSVLFVVNNGNPNSSRP